MKAAVVKGLAQTPVYEEFAEPTALAEERLVAVTASALSHLTRSRASGKHYSSSGHFPFVAGIDGVGRLEDGSRVFFVLPSRPHGALAERTVVPAHRCLPLHDDLDDVTAAAIANPGMSSWAAYAERARLKPGETVLVNGATGTSGRLAVQIARHMGAGRIIATGRNEEALQELESLGADVTIPLLQEESALDVAFSREFAAGVDVVIDYLWGRSAELVLTAAARAGQDARPIRYVQVGSMSGSDINLPASVLRSSAIQLMGSGIGSISLDRLIACIADLLKAAGRGGFRIATRMAPLSDIENAWAWDETGGRTVIVTEA
ncbi:zinc-binding alcohol dehydrogenase family protein [Neorhizobium lilium]|uniref:Zinc-binding alcohol dehydrogenase family protein n=1 Tax=Neorhizobium lilium TaxID=2503024 RepID=A0A3S3S7Z7_9HYPH|nr:zinc-binding alcohol dehydrogenase family protein [Neorhizobium lilium]RWX79095.1 zinc-binding alcohol dehydrogenase family protein [Neorhizobium lilium]